MKVVPRSNIDKIAFYETHTAPWSANAVAIGTSAAAVADLSAKAAAARAAYQAQWAAQSAAMSATIALNIAIEAMQTTGSAILKQIRAKAATDGGGVYSLASIPAPAKPSPVGAPGQPTDFKSTLYANGSLKLTWKCPNPSGAAGTMYQVWRRVGPAGELTYLGGSGTKDFVDDSIPAGASQMTYQIQAIRSTKAGPWAQFNVNFGTSGGAAATPVRLAA